MLKYFYKSFLLLYFLFYFLGAPLLYASQEYNTPKDAFYYFKMGSYAYRNDQKAEALKLFRLAADLGSIGATWKIGCMYMYGDGVAKDLKTAFKYFESIINHSVEPGSSDEIYISDALVELGDYYYSLGDKNVLHAYQKARQFYYQAATNFANPRAEFFLGLMLLKGLGGVQDKILAARWFQLAAKKGNPPAQAMFGDMLFKAGNVTYGLALLIAANDRANPEDHEWIKTLYENALSMVNTEDRQVAQSFAMDIENQTKF